MIEAGSSVLWSKRIGSLQQGAFRKGHLVIYCDGPMLIFMTDLPLISSVLFLLYIYQIIISRVLLHFCGSRFTLPEDSWVGITVYESFGQIGSYHASVQIYTDDALFSSCGKKVEPTLLESYPGALICDPFTRGHTYFCPRYWTEEGPCARLPIVMTCM